jgi:protocatechuate 3,4-dioxygenase beta subunit
MRQTASWRMVARGLPVVASLVAMLVPLVVHGQQHGDAGQERRASLRGRVLDRGTGKPVAGAFVSVDTVRPRLENSQLVPGASDAEGSYATTDAEGRFHLPSVKPGSRILSAVLLKSLFIRTGRMLDLSPGQSMEDLELRLTLPGVVRGKVVDEHGVPVPGVRVSAVVEEFYAGEVRQYIRGVSLTDEEGQYELRDIFPAGAKFRLMAQWIPKDYKVLALEKAPAEPQRRRPAYGTAFYPGSPDLRGGSILQLAGDEMRDLPEFRLRREPALCIEGKAIAPADRQQLRLTLEEASPSFAASPRGGLFGFPRMGELDGRREFRICGLPAGTYRISIHDSVAMAPAEHLGEIEVELGDRDATGVEVPLVAPRKQKVELSWAGRAPETMPTGIARISLQPLTRGMIHGEQTSARLPENLPDGGETEIPAVWAGDYAVGVTLPGIDPTRVPGGMGRGPDDANAAVGVYMKDVRYGSNSVRAKPLRLGGEAPDTPIRVVLDHGAGTVTARVSDREGKPVDDVAVYLLAMDATGEAELADRLIVGQTDQFGRYTWTRSIPPGTYRAVATRELTDYSPESIHEIWLARARAPEFRVPENGSAEVSVTMGAR